MFPRPPAEFLARIYSPEYIKAHYADAFSPQADQTELLIAAAHAARLRPGGRLLDVGCGAGSFLAAALRSGLTCEGYEPDAAVASLAAAAAGCPVHHGALEGIAGPFDVIHLADVLEHLDEPAATLRTLVALLAPEGFIIARGPLEAHRSLFAFAMRIRRRARALVRPTISSVPPWHLTLFTLDGWHRLAHRAGLVVKEEVISEKPWPDAALRFDLKARIGRASLWVAESSLGKWLRIGNHVFSIWTR
ncbi:MAG: hypothetical protein HKUEN07_07060 [Rhodocyclaceae bacterium]|nr:MAG: hypothetical protein HKUEN07_07060 [Rhodocyclaceae bacterium]